MVALFFLAFLEFMDAGKFFFFVMPELDMQLKMHALNEEGVRSITAEAIAGTITACVNSFFAIKLVKTHENIMSFAEVITGSGLVVWHEPMLEWLSTFNYVALWERLF